MTDPSVATRIGVAFARVDSMPRSQLLTTLRTRLIGELFGDAEAVASTLTPDFELTMHGGPEPLILDRAMLLAAVEQQSTTGALMWTEFGFLGESGNVLTGHGRLCMLTERSLVTVPIAVFLNFEGTLMGSEIVFTGAAGAPQLLDSEALPARESLRKGLAAV